MNIEDLMERYMNEELVSFNKTELKKIRSQLKRDLNSNDEMLSLPLTEDERSFWGSESGTYSSQINDIEDLLQNK